MSEPEKPLHVKVAEALGVEPAHEWRLMNEAETGVYISFDSQREAKEYLADNLRRFPQGYLARDGAHVVLHELFARYDRDWVVTGPLLTKYTNGVHRAVDGSWNAMSRGLIPRIVNGPDPLVAVCNLILELGAAGMLEWKVSC